LDFESVSPSVIKSVRQRELLNGSLALNARDQTPQLGDYRPGRLDEKRLDLACYSDLIEFGRYGI